VAGRSAYQQLYNQVQVLFRSTLSIQVHFVTGSKREILNKLIIHDNLEKPLKLEQIGVQCGGR